MIYGSGRLCLYELSVKIITKKKMLAVVLQMAHHQENKSYFPFFFFYKKSFPKESHAFFVQLIRKNFQVLLCVDKCLMPMKKLEILQLEKNIFYLFIYFFWQDFLCAPIDRSLKMGLAPLLSNSRYTDL